MTSLEIIFDVVKLVFIGAGIFLVSCAALVIGSLWKELRNG
jgi:hypothetical protein